MNLDDLDVFGNKKAVIIRDDENSNIEISAPFGSINKANYGLALDLKQKKAVVMAKKVNESGGDEVTALENLGNRLWGEIDYFVKLESESELD